MPKWQAGIGHNYVDRLDEVAISVGSDHFTRRRLVEVAGVANFMAAETLSRSLERFRPKSVRELAKRMDLFMLTEIDGIGDTAVFVWCSLLEAKGVNVNTWLSMDFSEEEGDC